MSNVDKEYKNYGNKAPLNGTVDMTFPFPSVIADTYNETTNLQTIQLVKLKEVSGETSICNPYQTSPITKEAESSVFGIVCAAGDRIGPEEGYEFDETNEIYTALPGNMLRVLRRGVINFKIKSTTALSKNLAKLKCYKNDATGEIIVATADPSAGTTKATLMEKVKVIGMIDGFRLKLYVDFI